MVKFSPANTKLKQLYIHTVIKKWLENKRKLYSFDLLSGWSCPQAKECLAKVYDTPDGRRVRDGKNMVFRCFSASQEALLPNVYNSRKFNMDKMRECKTSKQMVDAIQGSLPTNTGVIRIHVAGDFFNQLYFDAWCTVARNNPEQLFYAYTKNLNVWLRRIECIPENLVLTASRGGRLDHLIDKHSLREAKVVFSVEEAERLNLEIDHDDSHAANPYTRNESFALLIHGLQAAGSEAGKAVRKLKGEGSYSNKKKGGK